MGTMKRLRLIEGVFSAAQGLACPVCLGDSGEFQHAGEPRVIPGNDSYEAGWPGRGDLIVIPFSGECGHDWELCVGFHKGNNSIFARFDASHKREG